MSDDTWTPLNIPPDAFADGAYLAIKAKLDALEAENVRLNRKLAEVMVEHPCYNLSKEFEAENAHLREALVEISESECPDYCKSCELMCLACLAKEALREI